MVGNVCLRISELEAAVLTRPNRHLRNEVRRGLTGPVSEPFRFDRGRDVKASAIRTAQVLLFRRQCRSTLIWHNYASRSFELTAENNGNFGLSLCHDSIAI